MGSVRYLKSAVLALLLYAAGEGFYLLACAAEGSDAVARLAVFFVVSVLLITGLHCFLWRGCRPGRRVLMFFLFCLLTLLLDLVLSALGVSRAIRRLTGLADAGEFGGAAVSMLRICLQAASMAAAEAVSELVIAVRGLRRKKEQGCAPAPLHGR